MRPVDAFMNFQYIIETRKILYALFGQFGRVIDVVHVRREELRGRAWIVYEDVAGAANALRNLQDFPFYGIPLVCVVGMVGVGRGYLTVVLLPFVAED